MQVLKRDTVAQCRKDALMDYKTLIYNAPAIGKKSVV